MLLLVSGDITAQPAHQILCQVGLRSLSVPWAAPGCCVGPVWYRTELNQEEQAKS